MGPSLALWLHGHVHRTADYNVNGTRVMCNPRGYFPTDLVEGFRPNQVIDLEALA